MPSTHGPGKGLKVALLLVLVLGKARVVCRCCSRLDELEGDRALVSSYLRYSFKNSSQKSSRSGDTQSLDRIEIICYQSAHKLEDKHYDIVVCDEIHLGLV